MVQRGVVQRGCQDGCGACLVQTRRGNALVIKQLDLTKSTSTSSACISSTISQMGWKQIFQ